MHLFKPVRPLPTVTATNVSNRGPDPKSESMLKVVIPDLPISSLCLDMFSKLRERKLMEKSDVNVRNKETK